MTELGNNPTERAYDATPSVISLLHHYGFDLGGCTIAQLLLDWQNHYPATWIRLATVEALYQGRYKAVSVGQILAMWQRRSQPIYHFNHEFERLVCNNLPEEQVLSAPSPPKERLASRSTALEAKRPDPSVALQLPSFESTALPEAAIMLALRTLHSPEMAVLAEHGLSDQNGSTEAQRPAEENPQAPIQTYSYKLRSDETPPDAAAHHPKETLTQSEVAQTVPPAEAVSTHTCHETDDGLEDKSIVPKCHQPEHEQPPATHQFTDIAVASPSDEAQAPSSLAQVGLIARILQQLDQQELNARAMFPDVGLLAIAPQHKPTLQLHLATHYQPIWLTAASSKQPIHQFTPTPALPDFYSKLKIIAHSPEEPVDNPLSQ